MEVRALATTRAGVRLVVARLPTGPGVYRFRDGNGRALYIGRAVDLRRRVDSYWGGLRDRRHLLRMVPRVERVEALTCDSEHEASWLERNLLERGKPYWNRTRGGQEVPVYIRLDRQPTSANLKVVHTRQTSDRSLHFGPYLGGLRVRTAVSALDRLLPLAYAADRLNGSERDMARVRGVEPGTRAALIDRVIAVLERDPAALADLRGELAQRRDTAAADLAFERAARLQAEIEAIDWVAAEQKVTALDPHEATIHGWAGGLLVRLEVRSGRLCTWTQRACTESAALPLVAATPPTWANFAHRNATLAAALLA